MKNPADMPERENHALAADATAASAPVIDVSRPPVKAPEALQANQSETDADVKPTVPQAQEDKPLKWLGMTLPKPVSDTFNSIHHFGERMRNGAIHALPRNVVNHSSNVIAGMQLVGETMMFKANGTKLVPEQYKGVWWRNIVEPPKSIAKSVFGKEAMKASDFTEVFTKNYYSNDPAKLREASLRDSMHGELKLINRWQARSTFAGLAGMCLAALFPDVKDTPEELQKRTEMRHNNPALYVAQNIGHALWFPVGTVIEMGQRGIAKVTGHKAPESEVGKYKRQFTGLSITVAGICSFLSGFRNVKGDSYAVNSAHSVGGIITALAGSQLLTAVGSDQGWERFGSIQWLRMAFLPKSIGNRYTPNAQGQLENGRHWYLGGQIALQSTNTMSYLIGGAHKREDGSIVDHKAERLKAKERAISDKAERKQQKASKGHSDNTQAGSDVSATPVSHISNAQEVMRAMPDRVAPEAAASV